MYTYVEYMYSRISFATVKSFNYKIVLTCKMLRKYLDKNFILSILYAAYSDSISGWVTDMKHAAKA